MPDCRRPCRALAVAVAAVLLAGCSGSSSPSLAPSTAASDVSGSATDAPDSGAPAAGTSDPATASPAPTDDAAPDLVLQGDGLGLLQGDSPQPLPFGSTGAQVVQQAVEDALGPVVVTPLADCAQGPRTALVVDGFTVLLDGDRFVGWTDAGAPDRSLTTADGVGVGSRLADLQSALPDLQVAQAPPGVTFASATGLTGLLSAPDEAATVTAISGGQTCVH